MSGLTAAQWELVVEHRAFADRAAARARGRWPGQDPVSIDEWAMEGLIDAARRYDPTVGAKFTTYAWVRISGAIVDGYRRSIDWDRRRRIVEVDLDELGDQRLRCDDPGYDRVVDAVHAAATIAGLALSERDRYVIVELGSGTTLREIGQALGVSESRVCQIRGDIYERMHGRPTRRQAAARARAST